jgi:hypothetical protein
MACEGVVSCLDGGKDGSSPFMDNPGSNPGTRPIFIFGLNNNESRKNLLAGWPG